MGRRARFNLPGVPQHVIQRGNNREPCFYAKEDYVAYLEFLHIVSERTDCHVHAYVLMTNHVHMIITPMQEHDIRTSCTSKGHYKVKSKGTTD